MHEVDLSENNFKDYESITRSSVCDLDWDVSFHDDDNDGCRNVRIQVNGLTGDCAGCTITSYNLSLNSNDVITTYDETTQTWGSAGLLTLGNWALDPSISRYRYSNLDGNNNTLLSSFSYTSSAQNMSLVTLGNGEVVKLVEDLPFGENGFDIVYTGFVESDSSAHRIVISQGTSAEQQSVDPQITVYERDTSTEGWEQVLPSYFSLRKEHEVADLSVSHGGDIVSVVMTDHFSFTSDTTSYVDYVREINGQLRLLHRFTYKIPNNDGLYGDVYRSELSKTGRFMTVTRLGQINLYDMSNLLPDIGGSDLPSVVVFPNPTTGIVSTNSISYIKVDVYNSLAQKIKVIDSQVIDISDVAAGMYFLSFTLTDGTERIAKVIKQ